MQPESPAVAFDAALEILSRGEIDVRRQIAWSSNATFLADVSSGERGILAVYKPQRGEAPLWDFPVGTLCLREMAAFVVSEDLGWHLVPPTVLRDGPLGFGVLQAFIPHDPDEHYLALERIDLDAVHRIAAFDVLVNNADRKSGHVLVAEDGALWAIDHGLAFHVEPKLRTVIWDFAGERLPADILDDLRAFRARLADSEGATRAHLSEMLASGEVDALLARAEALIARPFFPEADPGRRVVPWPPV